MLGVPLCAAIFGYPQANFTYETCKHVFCMFVRTCSAICIIYEVGTSGIIMSFGGGEDREKRTEV